MTDENILIEVNLCDYITYCCTGTCMCQCEYLYSWESCDENKHWRYKTVCNCCVLSFDFQCGHQCLNSCRSLKPCSHFFCTPLFVCINTTCYLCCDNHCALSCCCFQTPEHKLCNFADLFFIRGTKRFSFVTLSSSPKLPVQLPPPQRVIT